MARLPVRQPRRVLPAVNTPSPRQISAVAATCPACGKVRYLTRAAAKRSARRQSRRMRPCQCEGFWHLATTGAWQRRAFYRERGT
jgi:DNA-directed RNA polymerase subunit M/transcription elongation factor TFIIS